jgi:hypothetical protein
MAPCSGTSSAPVTAAGSADPKAPAPQGKRCDDRSLSRLQDTARQRPLVSTPRTLVGDLLGASDGTREGETDGSLLGMRVGGRVGCVVGLVLGATVGVLLDRHTPALSRTPFSNHIEWS